MAFVSFLIGLFVGLVLLGWQRFRSNAKLNRLLRNLKSTEPAPASFSALSQLSLAIAYQRQFQTQLEDQLELYRQVLTLAPIGYLQFDDENRLIWLNKAAQDLLGISADPAMYPRLLLEVVRSYELDELVEHTRTEQLPCQQEWTFYPASLDPSVIAQQQPCALRGHGFPLSGNQVGVFLEDRRESVTLAQQRDRWASDVAHELKTPLTSIRLVAETLHSRLDPPLQSWVERLINETTRLSALVQDLLDLSHLDRGSTHRLRVSTVNLVELLHAAWMNLEPLARKKNLTLNYDGAEQVIAQVDDQRLYRVLINVLDNSIKYSPPWQRVQVRIALEPPTASPTDLGDRTSTQVVIDVIDAGPGFPATALSQVFDRFYRADPSRTHGTNSRSLDKNQVISALDSSPNAAPLDKNTSDSMTPTHRDETTIDVEPNSYSSRFPVAQPSGSGLGLAIVRQIIEAHHGSVQASNHPETGGAWIRVYLPRQQSS